MFKLIYRQLAYEPFRTLLTGAAVASALAVILLLEARKGVSTLKRPKMI